MQSKREEKIKTVELYLIIEAMNATKCGPMHSSDDDCAVDLRNNRTPLPVSNFRSMQQ